MKKIAIVFISVLLFPFLGHTQTTDSKSIEGIDYISTYSDGLAAIKKGNEWAFIDQQGAIVINFRNDLVMSEFDNGKYPVFKDNRCLITKVEDGITYFGYIDTKGQIAIEPKFLNAINFNNNMAIALELDKQVFGMNDIFKKEQVAYIYFQVVINTKGEVIYYLTQEPTRITLDKDFLKRPPKITSKLISDGAFAIWSKDKKWEIKKLEY